jgi:hypothetical protein
MSLLSVELMNFCGESEIDGIWVRQFDCNVFKSKSLPKMDFYHVIPPPCEMEIFGVNVQRSPRLHELRYSVSILEFNGARLFKGQIRLFGLESEKRNRYGPFMIDDISIRNREHGLEFLNSGLDAVGSILVGHGLTIAEVATGGYVFIEQYSNDISSATVYPDLLSLLRGAKQLFGFS